MRRRRKSEDEYLNDRKPPTFLLSDSRRMFGIRKMALLKSLVLVSLAVSVAAWGEERTSANCRYRYRAQTVINARMYPGLNYNINTLDECLEDCKKHNAKLAPDQFPCQGVVHEVDFRKSCYLVALMDYEKLDDSYSEHSGFEAAFIIECDGKAPPPLPSRQPGPVPKPTTPAPATTPRPQPPRPPTTSGVGCGLQHKDFMPMLSGNVNNRIINGREAIPHSWPWLLGMTYGDSDSHACGANLLRVRDDLEETDMMITAAHCVNKDSNNQPSVSYLGVRAGKHDIAVKESGEERRRLVEGRFVEGFNHYMKDDIVIIRLDRPIKFSDTIRPICLPPQDEPTPAGKLCYAAGWGRDNPSSYSSPSAMQQARTPANTDDACSRIWYSSYDKTKICAGDLKATTCNGDSGGMFVCQESDGRWAQYGLTSFGVGGCVSNSHPTIFTRVSAYTNWIQRQIREMSKLV